MDFGHFRTDRMTALANREERCSKRRAVTLREWRETETDVRHVPNL